MQLIIKNALKYFGMFVLIYGTLTIIGLIPAVGCFFNNVYRSTSQPVLQRTLSKAYIQLKSVENDPDIIRVEFASKEMVQKQVEEARKSGQKRAPIQGNSFEFGFYNLFFSFFLFLISLLLLSPVSLMEKVTGILLGSLIFYLYTVLKMNFALLSHFNEPEINIYQTGGVILKAIRSILYFMSLGLNVLVVLIIWAFLAFRKDNWKKMLDKSISLFSKKS